MMDRESDAPRKAVYGRLEAERPRRWEALRGCTVEHILFGEGTISNVMMPDWSNPVHLAVRFGPRERVFHLSSLGDRTKFPGHAFPDPLAGLIAQAERAIAGEQRRREEERQREEREAREAACRRQELEAARLREQRQAVANEEIARRAQAERRLGDIIDKVDQDQPLAEEEFRLLLRERRHELLLGYYARGHARTGEYRAIVKAGAAWREAKEPDYALRVTALLLGSLDRLPESARCAVFTARGEAFLDRHELAEAKEAALAAIACARHRPQPHQLLGAVLMAGGDTTNGELHFAKARELAGGHGVGRVEKAQQAEIQRQLHSHALQPARQKALAADLLRIDPRRYHWLDAYL